MNMAFDKKYNKPEKDDDNDEIELLDVENYRGGKDTQFSHQGLVMITMRKCIEAGCKEMHPGWIEEKLDIRGNTIKTYKEDTRESFIECIKTAEMVMACDIDKEAFDTLAEIKKKIAEVKKQFHIAEKTYWISMPVREKQASVQQGIIYQEGMFNQNLRYFHEFKKMEVDLHREIFKELQRLTSRLGFYEEEEYEAA